MLIDEAERLASIRPVFFALASGQWMRTRDYIQNRYEDPEGWENFLAENDLSPEEFDRYEQWWVSAAGQAVESSLAKQFMDSIYRTASEENLPELRDFFRNHATWQDFIRELVDCTPDDAEPNGGELSYFAEYAISGGLCYTNSDEAEFDEDLIIDEVEYWFAESYDEIQQILLSAYDAISKIR